MEHRNTKDVLRQVRESLVELFIALARIVFFWIPGGDLAKGKALGRFNKNLEIKSILQTYEKQYQEMKHSFKYIRKPVINEEPMNV